MKVNGVEFIAILECRQRGKSHVDELRFDSTQEMQEFVEKNRMVRDDKGKLLRRGSFDYAVQRHEMMHPSI